MLWVSIGLAGFALLQAVPEIRRPWLAAGRWGGAGSFLLGAGVAVGWTPSIGPTLGAILTLAAASDTVWTGAALLVAYALWMSHRPLLGVRRSAALDDVREPKRVVEKQARAPQ